MFHSACPRGHAARGPAGPDGSLPWLADSLLVLCGFETAGDLIDLLTGGVSAATLDAAVDAAAAVACDVLVALAVALGLDDGLLGGHGAQVLAMLAKLWAAHWDGVVAGLVARAILQAFAPDLRASIRRSTAEGYSRSPRDAEARLPASHPSWERLRHGGGLAVPGVTG